MTIEIYQNELKAVAMACAVKDYRDALNGVLVETNGQRSVLVACDGHRMNIVRRDQGNEEHEKISYIMPIDFVKTLLSNKNADRITLDFCNGIITATTSSGTITAPAIAEQFPDYRRIVPSSASGEAVNYAPDYLASLQKALRIYSNNPKKFLYMQQNGYAVGFVIYESFFGGIMPYRPVKLDGDAVDDTAECLALFKEEF